MKLPNCAKRLLGSAKLLAASAIAMASTQLSAETLTLNPIADFYTTNGTVSNLTNRLLVSEAQRSFLTFDISGLDPATIESATLRLYLVFDTNNLQAARDVTVETFSASIAGTLNEGGSSPAVSSSFTPTLSGETALTNVDGRVSSQYWEWNVLDLITGTEGADGSMSHSIGFVFYRTGTAAAPFRFTDRDPANDSTPSLNGFAPELIITTIPEPSNAGLLMAIPMCLAVLSIRRKPLR